MALNGSSASRFKLAEGNLSLLQEFIRKDPDSYKDEFLEQFHHFMQSMKLLELQPHLDRSTVDQLIDIANFIATVAFCYPDKAKEFVDVLIAALKSSNIVAQLDSELRMSFCRAIMMQTNRRKSIVNSHEFLPVFFDLTDCGDKQLRKFILGSVISQIKLATTGKKKRVKGRKIKRKAILISTTSSMSPESTKIQNFVFTQLKDSRAMCARSAQKILVEAYRRGYWRDSKTANVLAMECVFHRVRRIQVGTMKFFLGSPQDEEGEEDSDSDADANDKADDFRALKDATASLRYGKKTKKRQKEVEKAKRAINKEKKSKKEGRSKYCNLEALRAIYDPQKFADRLFGCLESKKNEKFVFRLLQVALCARVIGIHQLQTLGFYSYLHRYLQPKQQEVTRILLYAAQACHELVPPDLVQQLIRVVAQNFVSDHTSSEAITVGINTIREILTNCPGSATEELLRDLTEYKSYKNKNVSMAARGLITLFRSLNPKLLHHKDRGRPTQTDASGIVTNPQKKLEFGAANYVEFVPGSEVLPQDEPALIPENDGDTDDSDGWIDIDHSDNEEDKSDSEAENDSGDNSSDWETDDDIDEVEAEKSALEKAKSVSETRILTDADFRMIRAHQVRSKMNTNNKTGKGNLKRTNDEILLDEEIQEKMARKETSKDGLPRLNDIEHFHKKIQKQNKQERLDQIKEGRDENEKFGRPKKRGAHVGRTNRELAKCKNFQMVRHKVRGKNRQRSFRDQQISLRNYLLRQDGKKVI
ncbi:SDA1 domain-containing protein [Ditylenchus destructor]|nr:SDA1 domain-containing protein [Ditylenchus destructor]